MTSPDTFPSESIGVDEQNPWPGLESFAEGDAFFFHGRTEEAAELLRRVKREPLTVLFGRSGLGKTSLLRAGLFPQLRTADYLPFRIRLDHGKTAPPLAQQVKTMITLGIDNREFDAPRPLPEQTLWEYFHAKSTVFWNDKSRILTPVLVFDQFEEIFTLGNMTEAQRLRSEAFLTEVADLIENRPPAGLKVKLESGEVEAGGFSFTDATCKIVFSLREDYLAHLETLRARIPSLANNRMRIVPMSGDQAFEVVAKAGAGAKLIDDAVARRIVQFVAAAEDLSQSGTNGEAATGNLETDPALLSLFCRKLNDQRLKSGLPQITLDLVRGNRQEILTRFYEDCILALNPSAQEGARNFVENCLLTKTGHRDNFALDNALQEPGMDEEVLDELVSRRLLRYDDRTGRRVELAHDVLVAVVRASREVRKQQRIEAAERARAEQEVLAAEAKAAGDRARAEQERAEAEAKAAAEHERAAAAEALAKQAADARARADELIRFLIFDLRDKLSSIGQLPLMKEVNERTIAYFEKFESSEETDDTKWAKAVALQSRGNIRLDEGLTGQAVDAHTSSLAIFRELAQGSDEPEIHQYGVASQCASLAYALEVQGKITNARELYQEAYDITEQLLKKEKPAAYLQSTLTSDRELIAGIVKAQGKLAEALELYQVCLREREERAAANPEDDAAQTQLSCSHISLGDVASGQGQLALALKYFNDSLTIRKKLAEQNPSDTTRQHYLSQSYDRIGESQRLFGKTNEALEAFTESDQIVARLTKHDPNNTAWLRSYSVTRFRLAEIQTVAGFTKFASDVFSGVLTFRKGLANVDESNAGAQDDLAEAYVRAGDSDVWNGQLTAAAEKYRQAFDIRSLLAEKDSTNADRRSSLAEAYERLGDIFSMRRNPKKALEHYSQAREIRESLAKNDQSNLSRVSDLATSQVNLGDAHRLLGENGRARELYSDALSLRQMLGAADPDNVQWQSRLAVSFGKLGEACGALNDMATALTHFQQSIGVLAKLTELENAEWQIDAGDIACSACQALMSTGNFAAALEVLRSSIPIREALAKLDPANFKRHAELVRTLSLTASAILLAEPASRAEAIELLRKAGEIMSGFKGKVELTSEQQEWLEAIEKVSSHEDIARELAALQMAAPSATESPATKRINSAEELSN